MEKTINFDLVSDLYDYYVNTDMDIPFFLEETKNVTGEILELMCGTGRVSIPLLREGRDLTCVDYCQNMLFRFKEKIMDESLSADVIQQDVSALNLDKKFDMAFIPFHSFSELADKEKQIKTLNKIYEHLNDGGSFICTLQNPAIRIKSADGMTRFINPIKIDDGKTLIVSYINNYNSENGLVTGAQFYEIYDGYNILLEKRFLEIIFRFVQKVEFEEMASKAGFVVEKLYGNYDHSEFAADVSPFMLFVLRKK
jgi:ubiquinone/menaquinone biosynthesis C-methylase UbiE